MDGNKLSYKKGALGREITQLFYEAPRDQWGNFPHVFWVLTPKPFIDLVVVIVVDRLFVIIA